MAVSSPNVQRNNKPSGAQMFLDTMKTVNSMFQQKQQLEQYQRQLDLLQRQQTAQSLWDGIKALAPDYGGLGPLAVKNPQLFASAFAAIGMPEGTIHQIMRALKQVKNLRPDLQGQMGLELGITEWFDAATRLSEAPSLEAGRTALTEYLGTWAKNLDEQIKGITSLAGGVGGGTVEPVVPPDDGVVDEEIPEIPPPGGEVSTGDEEVPPPSGVREFSGNVEELAGDQVGRLLTKLGAGDNVSLDNLPEEYQKYIKPVTRTVGRPGSEREVTVYEVPEELAFFGKLPMNQAPPAVEKFTPFLLQVRKELTGKTSSGVTGDIPEPGWWNEDADTPVSPQVRAQTDYADIRRQEQERIQQEQELEAQGKLGRRADTSMASPAYQELSAQLRGRVATAGQTDVSNTWAQVGQPTEGTRYQPTMTPAPAYAGRGPQGPPVVSSYPQHSLGPTGKTVPGVTPIAPGQEEFGLEQASRARGNTGVKSVLSREVKTLLSTGTPIAELTPEQIGTLLGPPMKSADGHIQPSLNVELIDQLPISRDAKTYIKEHTPEIAGLLRIQAAIQREASGMQPETDETLRARFLRGQEARTRVIQDVRQAVKKGKESPVVLRTMEFGARVVDKLEQTGRNFIRAFESLPRAQQEAASEVINWGVREYAEDYRGALVEQAKFLKDAPREVLAQFLPGVEESTIKNFMMNLDAKNYKLNEAQFRSQEALQVANLLLRSASLSLAMKTPDNGGMTLPIGAAEIVGHYMKQYEETKKLYGDDFEEAIWQKEVQANQLLGQGQKYIGMISEGFGFQTETQTEKLGLVARIFGHEAISWDAVSFQPTNNLATFATRSGGKE